MGDSDRVPRLALFTLRWLDEPVVLAFEKRPAVEGLGSGAEGSGQIASLLPGGVLLGVLMTISFWLANRTLLGLAPIVARMAAGPAIRGMESAT